MQIPKFNYKIEKIWKNAFDRIYIKSTMFVRLFGFYGISTLVGNLTPNPSLYE